MKRKSTSKVNAIEKANKFHRAFNSSVTIEDFFRRNKDNVITVVHKVSKECVILNFSAHSKQSMIVDPPLDTYEGYCMRFGIEPKHAIDHLVKILREKPVRENF